MLGLSLFKRRPSLQFAPVARAQCPQKLFEEALRQLYTYAKERRSEALASIETSTGVLASFVDILTHLPVSSLKQHAQQALRFTLLDEEGCRLSYTQWEEIMGNRAKRQSNAFLAGLRSLIRLEKQGLGMVNSEGELLVPDIVVATQLPLYVMDELGIPAEGHLELKLLRQGQLGYEHFHIDQTWVLDGRELFTAKRDGALIKVGNTQHFIPSIIYFVAEALDLYFSSSWQHPSDQMAVWGLVSKLLTKTPFSRILDQSSGLVAIIPAYQMTLSYNDDGSPALRLIDGATSESGEKHYQDLLSREENDLLNARLANPAPLGSFIKVGDDRFVALTSRVGRVAETVKDLLLEGQEAKEALRENPVAAIARSIEKKGGYNEESLSFVDSLDEVFVDPPECLSSRVIEVGLQTQETIPDLSTTKTQWFLTELKERYINIAGRAYDWNSIQAEDFIDTYDVAKEQGQSEFEFENETFNIDQIDIKALRTFVKEQDLKNKKRKPDFEAKATPREKSDKVQYGPIIQSNFEILEYEAQQHPHIGFDLPLSGLQPAYQLKKHQQTGLAWLQKLWQSGYPGGLLADDMGLGKTLQTLCFLKWLSDNLKNQSQAAPILIVVPKILVKNWIAEAKHVFGQAFQGFEFTLDNRPNYYEASGCAAKDPNHSARARRECLSRQNWVITTYDLVQRHFEFFTDIEWRCLVLDEAQRIKNPTVSTTKNIKSIKANFVLALTGTPVENSFLDLWSIMDAVIPGGFMGSAKDFIDTYCQVDPLVAGQQLNQLLTAESDSSVRLMMRRLKSAELKDLPSKVVKKVWKTMPPIQAQYYEKIVKQRMYAKAMKQAESPLRTLCRLGRCSLLGADQAFDQGVLTSEQIEASARLTAFFEILDRIKARKEKVLIFLFSRELQLSLAETITQRYNLCKSPGVINGGMSALARQRVIDEFQNSAQGEFSALILTSRSSGIGITLTAATHVIHLERWWNPAVEDQCSDRAYRLGQQKDVTVWLPLCHRPNGLLSYDEALDNLLDSKREMSRSVLLPVNEEALGATLAQTLLSAGDVKA